MKRIIGYGSVVALALGFAAHFANAGGPGPLYSDKNLSDVQSASTALTNLGGATSTSPTFGTSATFSYATATTVPVFNGSKALVSSAVTPTELGYLTGVTSALQTQLDAKAPTASPTFTTKTTHSYATATTVATFNGSKELVSSAVTPTELGLLATADRLPIVERQPLAAVRTAGGVLGWTNPTGGSIIVTKLVLDVTTASNGASTIDCGIGTNATTSDDTLIDGASGTPAAVLDDVKNAGTNGANATKATSTQAVTCSEASGDVTGIAGFAYIYYHAI